MSVFFLSMWCMCVVGLTGCSQVSANDENNPVRNNTVITIVADPWPPFNCMESDEKQGYYVDICREIFEPLGYVVVYKNIPWTRAIAEVKQGHYDGLVAPTKVEGAGLIFSDEAVSLYRPAFFKRKDFQWSLNGRQSMEGVVLGAIESYEYCSWLDEYISANKTNPSRVQLVYGNDALSINLKKLHNKRVDIIVDNRYTTEYTLKRMKLEDSIVFAGEDDEEKYCFMAFTPAGNRGKWLKEAFSLGMKYLRESGRLHELQEKYNLPNWTELKDEQ